MASLAPGVDKAILIEGKWKAKFAKSMVFRLGIVSTALEFAIPNGFWSKMAW